MKIIIDDKIPYIRGAFENVAEVIYLSGADTTPEVVKDADVLVTRTRTICNKALLDGSAVKFIATATIGYDHIDTDYCDAAGINWTNAPGCNSASVEQYILSALLILAERKQIHLSDLCIGIIGVGNVGRKVAEVCGLLGMKVLLNDPPRQRSEGGSDFVSLVEIVEQADIITLHVPLLTTGEEATYHLVDGAFLSKIIRNPILINTCRGEVIATEAVKKALRDGKLSSFVCDCWENEPDVDRELLHWAALATPHIAGYSKDGKALGTEMSVRAISAFFGLGLDGWQVSGVEKPTRPIIDLDGRGLTVQQIIAQAVLSTYDLEADDRLFRNNPENFELQRNQYPTRREFSAYSIRAHFIDRDTLLLLEKLGFQILAE